MHLVIEFQSGSNLQPRVFIRTDSNGTEVKQNRWVQTLALLAYRRLTDNRGGQVRLDEIAALPSFKKTRLENIGKYVSAQYLDPHSLQTRFIDRYITPNTIGPYQLKLPPDRIIVDRPDLKEYIKYLLGKRALPRKDINYLLDLFDRSHNRYELSTCENLITDCIAVADSAPTPPQSLMANLLIKHAVVEWELGFRNYDPHILFAETKLQAMRIKNRENRDLLLGYALGLEALTMDQTRGNLPRILHLLDQSMKILNDMSLDSEDRHSITAGRLYHLHYLQMQFDSEMPTDKLLREAARLCKEAPDDSKFRFVNVQHGYSDCINLQSKMLYHARRRIPPDDGFLAELKTKLEAGQISLYASLGVANWVYRSYLRAGERDRAWEFLAQALVRHAELHEAAQFRRLADELGCNEFTQNNDSL